jgi:hypothetical protein
MPGLADPHTGSQPRKAVAAAGAVLVPALVLIFGAWLRWRMKCDEGCYDKPAGAHEPGHAWTSYTTSWQWDAQFALAAGGVMAAVATVLADREGTRHARHLRGPRCGRPLRRVDRLVLGLATPRVLIHPGTSLDAPSGLAPRVGRRYLAA